MQPLHHPHVVLLLGVILVALRLRHVEMEAGAQVVAERRGLLQRGVLQRERRVETEEGGEVGGQRGEGRGASMAGEP